MLISLAGLAETWEPNSKAVVVKEAELYRVPQQGGPSFGRVPVDSELTIVGSQQGNFLLVEVALENDEILEGWINQDAISGEKRMAPKIDRIKEEAPKKKIEEKKEIVLPADETLLLGRKPSFLYGLHLGGNFANIQNDVDTTVHQGIGFLVGGFVGMFLETMISLKLEGTYAQFGGTSPDDDLDYNFGFLELGLIPSYLTGPLEFFLGMHYGIGIGIGDIPSLINNQIQGVGDISGVFFQAGATYYIDIGNFAQLGIRVRYALSFKASPFFFQGVGLLGVLEFRG